MSGLNPITNKFATDATRDNYNIGPYPMKLTALIDRIKKSKRDICAECAIRVS